MDENNWDERLTRAALVVALAERNEDVGRLQGELRNMQARIAELEAQGEKREAELIKQVDIVIDLQQYIAELEAQLQALGVVVDAQNRQLKAIHLTQMVQAHEAKVQP